MTSGSRRIRVACAKCGYDKQRTLEAGDERTLEQLSASLRCGGCRTWGKNGAISVSLAASSTEKRCLRGAGETAAQPLDVHGTCLNCGHNENFNPKWRRGETLKSLARDITCAECGAEGSAGNIYLREATSPTQRQRKSKPPLHIGASVLATLAWPFEVLGLLIVIPLAATAVAIGRILATLWRPLLIGGSVVGGIAAFIGAAYVAAVLIGAAMSGPAVLVLRAAEHEHQDAVHNSPKGGYRERLDRTYADTSRQMTYYNRRTVGADD